MPTFGKDTIRRFINNVSEMKQLAARDFEDLLQVSVGLGTGRVVSLRLLSIREADLPPSVCNPCV